MTLQETYARLQTLGIPVAYRVFKSAQEPQFLVYYLDNSRKHGADSLNLISDDNIIIELYTDSKNIALEKQIESLFSDVELSKIESWIEDENLLMIAYEFTTINKE